MGHFAPRIFTRLYILIVIKCKIPSFCAKIDQKIFKKQEKVRIFAYFKAIVKIFKIPLFYFYNWREIPHWESIQGLYHTQWGISWTYVVR